jgi:hypothetical protein
MGLVCEPHGEPVGVTARLAEELGERLAGTDGAEFEVTVHHERLPLTEDTRNAELLQHLGELRRRNGWDLALCVVDVPMRAGGAPIVADADLGGGAALVSLPALGAMRLGRRVREVTEFVVRTQLRPRSGTAPDPGEDPALPLPGPFDCVRGADRIDLRILATRGHWRLLVGMVRANRPWRLVSGLTGALAAALAIGAYVLVNSSVWNLALNLGGLKLTLAAAFSVSLMVAWLILDHHLWTPRAHSTRARLYNVSTLFTLMIGVLVMYAGIFAVVLAASTFTMDPGYFRAQIGRPPGVGDYLTVTWLASSMAVVAGALGTGFESEDAVRQAAYSYREQERRAALEKSRDAEDVTQ